MIVDQMLFERRGIWLLTSIEEREELPIEEQVSVALMRLTGADYQTLGEEEQSIVRTRMRIYDVICPYGDCDVSKRMYVAIDDDFVWYCDKHMALSGVTDCIVSS